MKYKALLTSLITTNLLLNFSLHSDFISYNNNNTLTLYTDPFSTTLGSSPVNIDIYTYVSNDFLSNVKQYGGGASLTIGRFCFISDTVTMILEVNDRPDRVSAYPFVDIDQENFEGSSLAADPNNNGIYIGNDVWIGERVVIMPGVIIGDGAIIAARSVVLNSVEQYSVVAGNPATPVRYRFGQDVRLALQQLQWWNLDLSIIESIKSDLSANPDINTINSWIQLYLP